MINFNSSFSQLTLIFLAFFCTMSVYAQDEPSMLDEIELEEDQAYAFASFKTTRVVNSHSVEHVAGGVLDFRINHRFGFVNGGIKEFFGLDQSTVRLGLDYGLNDWFMIGIGRSSYEKTLDGFAKIKVLRQGADGKGSPVTMNVFSNIDLTTQTYADSARNEDFKSRLGFAHQVIVARKFSEGLTLQVMPTLVHRNLVETKLDNNDIFSLGVAGRLKLSKRVTLNAEYFYTDKSTLGEDFKNSLSIGFDIETGGHVFQLHVSNSTAMHYSGFVGETVGDFFDGDIHFGFNISRVFTLRKPKEFR